VKIPAPWSILIGCESLSIIETYVNMSLNSCLFIDIPIPFPFLNAALRIRTADVGDDIWIYLGPSFNGSFWLFFF
jgi:hypothetical protein